jgi:hypothetical protein
MHVPAPRDGVRKFLDEVERNVPTDLNIHVIMDNYGTHKTKLIRNWFAKRLLARALHADISLMDQPSRTVLRATD